MLFTFKKSKSIFHVLSKLFSIFILISFVSITSVACVGTSSNTEPEEIPEDILYIKTSESTLKYLRHEFIEDFHYRDVLAVYLEYTNNLTQKNCFEASFNYEAFQSERQLHESSYDLEDVDDNVTKRIRRGKTTTICILYNLYDNSDVELILSHKTSDGYVEESMILSLE